MTSRSQDTSGSDEPYDDWAVAPKTHNDSKQDTAPHDLSGAARVSAPAADPPLVFREGQEDIIRAVYVVFGPHMSRGEIDNIVLALRQVSTRL